MLLFMKSQEIDYYDYWQKNRKQNEGLLDREIESIKLISKVLKKGSKVLDLGCGNGNFLLALEKKFAIKGKGIDGSKAEVKEARGKGALVSGGDLQKPLNLKEKSDIIYSGEVLEHLFNPDFFLEQCNRTLKEGGFLVLSTPNLCAWFNRILMPLGIQPLFLEPSTKSKFVGAGFLKRFKKDSNPVGHVRVFCYDGLKDLLEMHGFKILELRGSIFDEGFPKNVLIVDRIFKNFPKMSAHFVILAKKVKEI